MKDQSLKFALALVSICLLSACARPDRGGAEALGPPPVIEKDAAETLVSGWKKEAEPQAMSANRQGLIVPDEVVPMNKEPVSVSGDGEWRKISNYDAENPSLPGEQEATMLAGRHATQYGAVRYNPSVDVYPVNDDVTPYAGMETSLPVSGEMIQQVFFPYGSAAINGMDRQELRELAHSLKDNGSAYRLTVVGHSSKRVDNVNDPFQKKMINFKMAQKRAGAVANVLNRAGAQPGWVVATSAGDSQPNLRRQGMAQEAADRRAEIYLNN